MSSKYFAVEFKGFRRGGYFNYLELPFKVGEYAIVQAERGEDMGKIVRVLTMVEIEKLGEPPLNILRASSSDDLERMRFNRRMEEESFQDCLGRIRDKKLNMKLVDVEYQYDCNKITFYFTAEKRVDFRDIVKDLAGVYKTRIELRQIGVRDEAKRIGGFGCCGLQQCCSSWLDEFNPISTQLAREQNLSLNPSKISGNCGRLLCCLLYEQSVYKRISEDYPALGSKCLVCQNNAVVSQVNIFRGFLVAKYEDECQEKIPIREYRKRLRLLRRGKLPETNNATDKNKISEKN